MEQKDLWKKELGELLSELGATLHLSGWSFKLVDPRPYELDEDMIYVGFAKLGTVTDIDILIDLVDELVILKLYYPHTAQDDPDAMIILPFGLAQFPNLTMEKEGGEA